MKKIFLFISILLLFLPSSSSAAELFFGSPAKEIGVGEKIEIGVFINTHNQPVNAIASHISFSNTTFDLEGFYDGGSVVSFWMERPSLTNDGTITFSGVIPGGLSTSRGYLFSLLLRAKKTGDATIVTANEEILLADGQGSAATIAKAPLSLRITAVSPPDFIPLYDATPPELFEPAVGRDKSILDEKYFLVFATQDKQSGIDHYEVKESRFDFLSFLDEWVVANSPYLLKDQSLAGHVLIKAVDRAGNERIVSMYLPNHRPWYQNIMIWIIMIIGACLLLFVFKKWLKKRV